MYNNIDNLGIMMLFATVLGIVMIWLFSKFAKRDSEGWDKSHERKGVKIIRIVLMCVWGFFVIASLLSIIISWDNMNDIQLFSLTCFFMLGISFFCYGLMFRQSPRGAWVKVRKIIAYILISFLYIMESGIPNVKGTFWDIFLASILVSGIFILLIWLLLKPYNRDNYIPYKQTEEGNKTQTALSAEKKQEILNNDNLLQSEGDTEKSAAHIHSHTQIEQSASGESENNKKPKGGLKIWRWILGSILSVALIIGGFAVSNYLNKEYLPKKRLDKVVESIVSKFNKEETRTEYALHILLDKYYDWGYGRIYIHCNGEYKNGNDYISMKLSDYSEDALSWIEKMARQGDAECQYKLGFMYDYSYDFQYYVKSSKEKAAYWYLEAAKNGYIKSFTSIGTCYLFGDGVLRNVEKALYWYSKGAEAGDPYAQYAYGELLLSGGETEQAKYWLKKAAVQGHEGAKDRLEKIID